MTEPRRPRALVIEDENIVRVLARDALVRAGFDVDEAADGAQALAHLEAEDRDYDILFVDLGLPGVRGESVMARAAELRPDVPIIVCTGEPVRSVPPRAILLAKPFSPRQIVALAKRIVAARNPAG